MPWDPGRDVVDDLLLDPLISVMAARPTFVIAKVAAFKKILTPLGAALLSSRAS
tara:strand:+ start:1455 stop:1616 length:162 start_codon:yes stop_codon:yes gene_type:complete